VIVETSVAGRLDFVALGAVRKETERCEGPFERLRASDEAAVCTDRISRQGQPHSGDARRRGREGVVGYQSILWIGLLPEVGECGFLKRV